VLAKVLAGSLPGRQADVMYDFLSLHSRDLAKETRGRNLFIHPSLGGFGVPVPIGWSFEVTRQQVREACRRVEKLGCWQSAERPLRHRSDVGDGLVKISSPWEDTSVTSTLEGLGHCSDRWKIDGDTEVWLIKGVVASRVDDYSSGTTAPVCQNVFDGQLFVDLDDDEWMGWRC
jgi:hypothetical protein